MAKRANYNEALIERAKKFHELHSKGYSIAEAAEVLKIDKSTIYKQLDCYAKINGVPGANYYKNVYARRTIKSKKTEANVNTNTETESSTGSHVLENNPEDTRTDEQKEEYRIKAVSDCFDSAFSSCEYLIGLIKTDINYYKDKLMKFKEELL